KHPFTKTGQAVVAALLTRWWGAVNDRIPPSLHSRLVRSIDGRPMEHTLRGSRSCAGVTELRSRPWRAVWWYGRLTAAADPRPRKRKASKDRPRPPRHG